MDDAAATAVFGIPLSLVASLTPGGILSIVIICIVFGKLVPKSVMEGRLADRDEIIDELKARDVNKDETIKELLKQNRLLTEGARTTVHVVESLPQAEGGE